MSVQKEPIRVAGFTFIRNAVLYDYPIVEAIRSILPLCDLMVVAVGQSDDNTLELIQSIADPKIRIIETVWDDNLRSGGRVLAVETDKAFAAIPDDYDWCFYIQGDEAVHEQDHPAIRKAMEQYLNDELTEGLLFKYAHFYGSYDYLGVSRRWYRREIRIIRNNKKIHSYKDAQGFRWYDGNKGRKLQVRLIEATIHHYGWVKHPEKQQSKVYNFNKLWHSDQTAPPSTPFKYNGTEPLQRFEGTHPAVMRARIDAVNWQFDSNPAAIRHTIKERISGWIEHITGWRPGEYKNYKRLSDSL